MNFLLFVIIDQPRGGWSEYYGEFDSLESAQEYLSVIDLEYLSAHVVDLSTKEVVWKSDPDA